MNWGEFKTTFRTYLLVDSQRKGRGIQNYINQLARASLIDLQRHVPELKTTDIIAYSTATGVKEWLNTVQFAVGDMVVRRKREEDLDYQIAYGNTKFGAPVYQAVSRQPTASEAETGTTAYLTDPPAVGSDPLTDTSRWVLVNVLSDTNDGAQEGSYNQTNSKITSARIRRYPTAANSLKNSLYRAIHIYDWEARYPLLDGTTRVQGVAFGNDGFVLAPKLAEDEKLLIHTEGESQFNELSGATEKYFGTTEKDAEYVLFDHPEAKAVAEYVKAHLAREVDKDLNMYKSHLTQYQKERQQIYRERRDYKLADIADPRPQSSSSGTSVGAMRIS